MNGKTSGLIQTLIQGGAVSLALISMYFFYNFASNHVAHNTEILIRLDESSRNETAATMELTETIRDLNAILK